MHLPLSFGRLIIPPCRKKPRAECPGLVVHCVCHPSMPLDAIRSRPCVIPTSLTPDTGQLSDASAAPTRWVRLLGPKLDGDLVIVAVIIRLPDVPAGHQCQPCFGRACAGLAASGDAHAIDDKEAVGFRELDVCLGRPPPAPPLGFAWSCH